MAPVRKSSSMYVDCLPRGRGKPKRTWMEVVTLDLKKSNLSDALAQDGLEWRIRINVADQGLIMMIITYSRSANSRVQSL